MNLVEGGGWGQLCRCYFRWLFRQVTPGTKLTSVKRYSMRVYCPCSPGACSKHTSWLSLRGGRGARAMNYIRTTMKTLNENNPTLKNSSKRKLDNSDDDDDDVGHTVKQPNTDKGIFSKFLVISSLNETKQITKISPFILHKSIQACAGEVKKVSKKKVSKKKKWVSPSGMY